jgi:hypothetical protein
MKIGLKLVPFWPVPYYSIEPFLAPCCSLSLGNGYCYSVIEPDQSSLTPLIMTPLITDQSSLTPLILLEFLL